MIGCSVLCVFLLLGDTAETSYRSALPPFITYGFAPSAWLRRYALGLTEEEMCYRPGQGTTECAGRSWKDHGGMKCDEIDPVMSNVQSDTMSGSEDADSPSIYAYSLSLLSS